MLVVPRQPTVHLVYGRTAATRGAGLTLGAWVSPRRSLRRGTARPSCDPRLRSTPAAPPPSPRRWGGFVPSRSSPSCRRAAWSPPQCPPPPADELYENASRAYARERYAEAAELRRGPRPGVPARLRGELLCFRGESLLRLGPPPRGDRGFRPSSGPGRVAPRSPGTLRRRAGAGGGGGGGRRGTPTEAAARRSPAAVGRAAGRPRSLDLGPRGRCSDLSNRSPRSWQGPVRPVPGGERCEESSSRRSRRFGPLGAAVAPAQEGGGGVAIDHKAVSCIVAEKFPKINACFSPNSNVARARVYFRAEGGTSWYYVEMKSDAPCMSGILPAAQGDDRQARGLLRPRHRQGFRRGPDPRVRPARRGQGERLQGQAAGGLPFEGLRPGLPDHARRLRRGGLGAGAAIGGGVALAGAAGGIYAATNSNDTTTTTFGGNATTTQPTAGTTTTTSTTHDTSPHELVLPVPGLAHEGHRSLRRHGRHVRHVPETSLKYFYDFDGNGVEDFQGPFCTQTRTYHVKSVDVFP